MKQSCTQIFVLSEIDGFSARCFKDLAQVFPSPAYFTFVYRFYVESASSRVPGCVEGTKFHGLFLELVQMITTRAREPPQ